MNRQPVAVAAAACVILAAQISLAQTAPPSPTQATPEPQAQAAVPVQTNLAQAVRLAEQRSGGRARKVELENERGADVYEIKTVSKDKSSKVMVDPASGNVVRVEGSGFLSSVFDKDDQQEDRAALARLEASPLTLATAIETAEKETGGRAIEASMKDRYGSTLFEVSVVKDWNKQKVWIDPATSRVIPQPPKQERYDD